MKEVVTDPPSERCSLSRLTSQQSWNNVDRGRDNKQIRTFLVLNSNKQSSEGCFQTPSTEVTPLKGKELKRRRPGQRWQPLILDFTSLKKITGW